MAPIQVSLACLDQGDYITERRREFINSIVIDKDFGPSTACVIIFIVHWRLV